LVDVLQWPSLIGCNENALLVTGGFQYEFTGSRQLSEVIAQRESKTSDFNSLTRRNSKTSDFNYLTKRNQISNFKNHQCLSRKYLIKYRSSKKYSAHDPIPK
jgi:hypothetical protein